MSVKFGTIHTYEFCFSSHGNTTSAAHSGSVHHDGVEADIRVDVERTGHIADRLHHRKRPDGIDGVDRAGSFQKIGELVGHETLTAVAAVIGRDTDLVARSGFEAGCFRLA